MIEGYIGRPGSGKTYTLTDRILRTAKSGTPVFTNFPVAAEGVYLFGPKDLLDLPAGLVVIDEAHLWFPSRMALRLPASWLAGLSQTRKNGWSLIWSTQHETRVDKVLRDVTSWMWLCSCWPPAPSKPLLFRAKSWEPEYFRQPGNAHRGPSSLRWFSRRVSEAYDTLGRIEVADHARQASDAYAGDDQAAGLPAKTGRGSRRSSPVTVS